MDKVRVNDFMFRVAQSRQKHYADHRSYAFRFGVGYRVFPLVSPMKDLMRFKGKKSQP